MYPHGNQPRFCVTVALDVVLPDSSRKGFIDVPGLEVGEPKEENDNTV